MAITVLLVDDEQEATETLQWFIKSKGFPCWVAKNSTEALESVKEHQPNVLFLDIQLKNSELDGFGVLQEASQLTFRSQMKIVMVTGYPDPEKEVKSKELGADGYLVKPLLPDKLLEMIKNFDSQRPR